MGGAVDVSAPRRALCVEDDAALHPLLEMELRRAGLRAVLCATVEAARAELADPPALAVVDLNLPDGSGLEVVRELAARCPSTPTLVLTVDDRPETVIAALRSGASGYVLKEDLATRLAAAIEDVSVGGMPLSASPAATVRQRLCAGAEGGEAGVPLTRTEVSLLEGLARGLSYDQCALRAGVSVNTVRTHVRAVYRKLEVSSKTEAVVEAVRRGLIALP
ncbi:MAG: response regulator transcription factor [Polyangiales bacterium]